MLKLLNKRNYLVDTPDPYVEVEILNDPHSLKTTSCIQNDHNPQWFQSFKYYLPPNPTKPTICQVKFVI